MNFLKNRTLRITILTAFLSLLIITVVTIVWYTYYNNARAVLKVSDDLITQITETVIEKTMNYLRPASMLSKMTSQLAREGALPLINNNQLESYVVEVLRTYPQLAMFYFGDENGNYIRSEKLSDSTIATKITNRNVKPPKVILKYRNKSGNVIKIETFKGDKFDPRARPWYKGAKKFREIYWTDVYIFLTHKRQLGITAAYPVIDRNGKLLGVFGSDIELSELSKFLQTLNIGKTGVAFIINKRNKVVAYPDLSLIVKEERGKFRSASINELGIDWITAAFQEYKRTGSNKFGFNLDKKRFISSFVPFPKSFGKDWRIVLVVPENDFIGPLKRTNIFTLLISLFVLFIAIIFVSILSHRISKPIIQLTEETKKIKDFQLDSKIEIKSSILEIHLMSDAISSMKTGLKAFRKYVPAGFVRQLIQTGEEARLGGQKRELTVFFSDIAGFTTASEGISPEELMVHLSEYLDKLTRIIMEQKGTVDKYIGDAIMTFWGAPLWEENHAFYACRTALLCQERICQLNKKWEREGKVLLPTRIGIHTGETIVGNVGSTERMNYTIMGDTVNLASRLEGVNKIYGTQIIVSYATYSKVSDKFLFRPLDIVAVKGKTQGIPIYELVGEKKEESSEKTEFCEQFARGFNAYLRQDWEEALKIFNEILQKIPSDVTASMYIDRCMKFQKNPPSPNWNGIFYLKSK